MVAAVAMIVVATLIALAVMWPASVTSSDPATDLFDARVTARLECPDELAAISEDITCEILQIELMEGPDAGQLFELPPVYDAQTSFDADDLIVVAGSPDLDASIRYSFADRQRLPVLATLAVLFAGAVILLGRERGFLALAGLGASAAILGLFTLPAVLDGAAPLGVALVTASAIAIVAMFATHGVSMMTSVALLGTIASLTLTTALGRLFVSLAQFTGFTSEEAFFLVAAAGDVDVRGLLLAGLVIGALGALDDMTLTQASLAFELRSADASMSRTEVFTRAMRVGRDHVGATVNTLVLAYAGASLPLLLLFVVGGRSWIDVANSELVATEIVRTLVGSIGLVASVPLTTALAAWAVGGPTAERAAEHGHDHDHHEGHDHGPASQVDVAPTPAGRPPLRKPTTGETPTVPTPPPTTATPTPGADTPADPPATTPPAEPAPRRTLRDRLRADVDDVTGPDERR